MARKTPIDLGFDALKLEGTLFSAQHLSRVAHEEAEHQREADYRIPAGLKLRDEIGRAFRIGQALWAGFARVRERSDVSPEKASVGFVTHLLQQAFGFDDLVPVAVQEANQRRFPIGHRARGNVPVVIAPHTLKLDAGDTQFADTRRRSAFQLAQEYLNAADESLWAIVANGPTLRLLRDNASLTRPAYLEADLERIFGEDRYADFSALWLILHASRFPAPGQPPRDCVLEHWRNAAKEEGARVQDRLRHGVTDALLALGSGFLQPAANHPLREAMERGDLTLDAYFQQLLRMVYRLIFWFTVEDRGLLHAPEAEVAARRAYAQGYASSLLRGRALRRAGYDRHADQWQGVATVFRALAHGEPRLGLPAMGGLFAPDQCPHLDTASLPNIALLQAVRSLAWFRDGGALTRVNYRDMGPEELGSIYESLLELVPELSLSQRHFDFIGLGVQTRGNARKLSGSYYTPDSLVQELLKSALDPVIESAIERHPEDPAGALLKLSVIDPACGSGHFLLAAARRLAERLATLRVLDGNPTPDDYRHALREIIAHCIFGVDRNPLALELARTALWLEAVTPDAPLSFLDHHLVCGDALLGLLDFSALKSGIPGEAYKPLTGDSKEVCQALAADNRKALKILEKIGQQKSLALMPEATRKALEQLDASADDSLDAIEAKRRAYTDLAAQAQDSPLAEAADLLMAAFLAPKTGTAPAPTTGDLVHVLYGTGADQALLAEARRVCRAARVLHWPLSFAQVMGRGGFDVVLGNPPWEVSQLSEEEFFAVRDCNVAGLSGARRKEAIAALQRDNPRLWSDYQTAKQVFEASNNSYRGNPRFNLTAVGKLNSYALFAETASRLISANGRAGLVLPTGIATDDSTKAFFGNVALGGRLASLYDFENRDAIFPGVHRSYKFCLFTLGASEAAEFACYLAKTEHLTDQRRRFTLTPKDLARLNPNTRTCPVFRSRRDAELTQKIYARVPIFWQEELKNEQGSILQQEINAWGLSFRQGLFNMTSDSHLFRDQTSENRLPLYEAKLIHQFDHRWATYSPARPENEADARDVTPAEKQDSAFTVRPRYWVDRREVYLRLSRLPKLLLDAIESNSSTLLTLGMASVLFADFVARRKATEAAIETLYPLWQAFVAAQPFAGVLAPTQLGLCGDNPPLLKPTDDSQLPAAPIDEIVTSEREATGWYATDPRRVDAWLARNRDLAHCLSEVPQLHDETEVWSAADRLLETSCPKWLMGWRDICRATDERTVIAAVFPTVGAGDTLLLMFPKQPASLCACLIADQNSLAHDFVARQKVGGTHLKYHTKKQITNLPPDAYTPADLDFIVPRVLELTYTAQDLKPFYDDVVADNPGYDHRSGDERGQPFAFDADRRALLRAELDARYAKLYGLTDEELRYILDPTEVMGADYPSETFRVLKNRELREFGEYRTAKLVLEAWERQSQEPLHVPVPRPTRRAQPLPVYDPQHTPASAKEDWLAGLICDVLAYAGPVNDYILRSILTTALAAEHNPHDAELAEWLEPVRANRLDNVLSWLRKLFGTPVTQNLSVTDPQRLQEILGDHRTEALARLLMDTYRMQQAELARLYGGAQSTPEADLTAAQLKRG